MALVYHDDPLGSITAITDWGSTSGFSVASGNKTGRYSEDAWGQRRDPLDWTGAPTTATDDGGPDSLTPRGFTGHEMLDDLGLVHMNGRIYDPLLGRFLSADLVIDGVTNLQGYNRYSYVKNNPLSYADPSGFWQASLFGALGIGAKVTFGHNQGQWNFGITFGIGLAAGASFNPNENLVGRLDAVKPDQKNTSGFIDTTAAGLGVKMIAEGGVPELLELGGSLKVSVEGNPTTDFWVGTTVEGAAGNILVGQVGGEAWAGAKIDVSNGLIEDDFDAASTGWQASIGGGALIGVDVVLYGENADSEANNKLTPTTEVNPLKNQQ